MATTSYWAQTIKFFGLAKMQLFLNNTQRSMKGALMDKNLKKFSLMNHAYLFPALVIVEQLKNSIYQNR